MISLSVKCDKSHYYKDGDKDSGILPKRINNQHTAN